MYFLVANHQAGVQFSYIDVVVFGKSLKLVPAEDCFTYNDFLLIHTHRIQVLHLSSLSLWIKLSSTMVVVQYLSELLLLFLNTQCLGRLQVLMESQ